jgi:hypothetical protein
MPGTSIGSTKYGLRRAGDRFGEMRVLEIDKPVN